MNGLKKEVGPVALDKYQFPSFDIGFDSQGLNIFNLLSNLDLQE